MLLLGWPACIWVQPSGEGSCPARLRFASDSDGEEVLVCRELVGARLSSLKSSVTVLAVDYTLVRLLQNLRSWLSLKPRLGGSSDSQIELIRTSFHTPHDFASSKDMGLEAHCFIPG